MRLRNALHSIRWRFVLANILLVAIAYGLTFIAVSSILNSYLLNQRVQEQIKNVRSLGVQVSSYLAQYDAGELYNLGLHSYEDGGGRMLVLNSAGIVQTDTFSEYNGMVLQFPEVETVLEGDAASAYGFHRITGDAGSFWALYCTSSVIHDGSLIGAVLFSTSVQDVVDTAEMLQRNMFMVFLLGLAAVLAATIVLTRYIARPVQQLTQTALRVAAGDWTSRVAVTGSGEVAELGRTFNMMCDRLQNVDVQRSEFVSDASHELKTPLASMKILVESLLYQDQVPEEIYKDFLADINKEIDRLTRLITDLLLLSKMDTENAVLNIAEVNVARAVEESTDALAPIARQRGVRIILKVPPELTLECDPLKLRQALNNLIENAIKYSGSEGFVEISAAESGQEICIQVRDNGVGMPKEDLPHIFERFYRVDKARSRETGGTGLGLHIVRRVALMHGGRVEVDSQVGEGSTFRLCLPLVPPPKDS
ncbi:MAG: HAMP domain-containing histidine kinase [Clostridia bacterium]|nr:HAMP domain-containing histidine kinase [Clostridia bacterium]